MHRADFIHSTLGEEIQSFISKGRTVRFYRIGCLWATTLRSCSEAFLFDNMLIESFRFEKPKRYLKNGWINGCKKRQTRRKHAKVFQDTGKYWNSLSREEQLEHFVSRRFILLFTTGSWDTWLLTFPCRQIFTYALMHIPIAWYSYRCECSLANSFMLKVYRIQLYELRWLKPMFLSQNIFAEIACSMRWIRPLRPEQRGALWLCKIQETQETRNSTNTHQTENHNMHMAFSNSVTSVTEYDLVLPIARPQHFCFAATRGERSVEKRWRTHTHTNYHNTVDIALDRDKHILIRIHVITCGYIVYSLSSTSYICIILYYHFRSVFIISLYFWSLNVQLCVYMHIFIEGMDFFLCFPLHFGQQHVSICFSFCFSWRPWTCLRYHQTYGHM